MNSMGFVEDFTDGLNAFVGPGKKFENPNQLASALGKPSSQITRYLKGERTKHLGAIGDILDVLKFKLLKPEESAPVVTSIVNNESDIDAMRALVTRVLCEYDVDGDAIKAVNNAILGISDARHKRKAAGE